MAILLLLAIVVDYMSIGPNSLRDRAAFFMALPAIREGFNGSPEDCRCSRWRHPEPARLHWRRLHRRSQRQRDPGAIIGLLWIYTIGCLLPGRARHGSRR
ncbi:hypothetical protein OOK41_31430 [Micromonospora sp. NBC_01655]|uniref:hypothetical protein n=1 Tax=Micromonospora sp. NBC_01655 TaxID=2975983 RepID=UPI00225A1FB3|nr:hypothetical protein [Micromonospora sp. NBC_01655]MCX4474773.1 hypothetical protein [Micromonospora sp. NBC_01655]